MALLIPFAFATSGIIQIHKLCIELAGKSCPWYRQCLERLRPCAGTPDDYAIAYAEKYCNLYDQRARYFSETGQTWIVGTRRCVQIVLLPHLIPFQPWSCAAIKQTAFDSHPACYVRPGRGYPSFCELPCNDWIQAFWTIKSVFVSGEAWSTLTGMNLLNRGRE